MMSPSALRLVARTPGHKPPRPPFGLRAWSQAAADFAVALEAPADDLRAISDVAEQVPGASTLASGTAVFVLGAAANRNRLWRLLGRGVRVTRATRCTALLVKGYVEIGAGIDKASGHDLAWGFAP